MNAAGWFLCLALCVAAITACAPPGASSTRVLDERATLRVENQAFLDMNVYMLRGAQRVRLGTVTGHSTREFTVPRDLVRGAHQVRFLADPIGGGRNPVSEELTINPGDRIEIVIPPG